MANSNHSQVQTGRFLQNGVCYIAVAAMLGTNAHIVCLCAAGCMGGNKLDAAAVRKLEKLPTKTQMIGSVAIMIKKVCMFSPLSLLTAQA